MLKFMQKQEKLLLCVILSLLVVVAAVILIQKSLPDDDETICNISIIVREAGDSFNKGINRAALDFNADVHIASGYSPSSAVQQSEYIDRELDNGASALVVLAEPYDPTSSGDGSMISIPIVSIGGSLSRSVCTIGPNNVEAGRMLADLAAERAVGICRIVCPEDPEGFALSRLNALTAALDSKGIVYQLYPCPLDRYSPPPGETSPVTLLVVDGKMTAGVCKAAGEDDVILGIGYNPALRTYLESGRISALVVYSDYDIGYMCIKAAAEAVRERGASRSVSIGLYVADKDTMYSDPIDKILFPIE